MDGVSPVIRKVFKYIIGLVAPKVGYACFLKKNLKKLDTEIEMLKNRKEYVQHMVSYARRNEEDIRPIVQKWLSEVDVFFIKCEEIKVLNEARQHGLCSNLVQRRKLSKKASEMTAEVIQLREKGSINIVSSTSLLINQSLLQKVVDFVNFESTMVIINQIMDALQENHVNRIGIYGIGRAGKTMLVKQILRKVKEKKVFDEAVMLTISQTVDLKTIQEQLANMLGLMFEQESIMERALKLRKRRMNEKSILIVFDGVSEYINLEKIGIPSVEHHIGCKLIFTSRIKELLLDEMYTNITFQVNDLVKAES